MSTISFSVEDELKRDVVTWAKRAKKSQSDLFRDMAKIYKFNQEMARFSAMTEKALKELDISTEEELYKYLESDETYEDRLRHQRLSGRHQK